MHHSTWSSRPTRLAAVLTALLPLIACSGPKSTGDTSSSSETSTERSSGGESQTASPGGSSPAETSSAERGTSPEPTPKTESAEAPGRPDLPDKPTVEVLEAGSEPRERLRYQFEPGRTEHMDIEMKMKVSMKLGSRNLPSRPIPPIHYRASITHRELTSEGHLKYDMKVDTIEIAADSEADPRLVRKLEEKVAPLEKLTASAIVTERGRTRDAQYDVPEGVDPAMRDQLRSFKKSLQQMSPLLPEKAVGPGARWTVVFPMKTNGVAMTQHATYTLRSRDGNQAELDVDITHQAEPQPMPTKGPGMQATLDSLTGGGSGELALDLGRLVSEWEASTETQMEATAQSGSRTVPMHIGFGLDLAIHPAEAADSADADGDATEPQTTEQG
jgi:hypothetical protein